jgi:hypothetical protein
MANNAGIELLLYIECEVPSCSDSFDAGNSEVVRYLQVKV